MKTLNAEPTFSEQPDQLPPSSRLGRSNEDLSLRAKPDYRGPLLQKFHDSDFKSKTDLNAPYPPVKQGEAGKVPFTFIISVLLCVASSLLL